jgi:hypothetical protein
VTKPDSYLFGDDGPVTALVPDIVDGPVKTEDELRMAEVARIQDEVLVSNMGVVAKMARFADIDEFEDHKTSETYASWVERHGKEEANRMWRIAKAAWLPNSSAPVALKYCTSVVLGILRAKATEKAAGNKQLSVAIAMPYPDDPEPKFSGVVRIREDDYR